MITTGARQAPTAPTKKIVWCEPKSVIVATATGRVFPAIAKRSARVRCLPLNRIGFAINRPSATGTWFELPGLMTLREGFVRSIRENHRSPQGGRKNQARAGRSGALGSAQECLESLVVR